MSRMRILMLGLVAVAALGMAACTPQDPEVTEEEQVSADQRPEEPSEGEGENGEGEGGGGEGETHTFVAVDTAFEEHPSELPAGEVTLAIDNQGGSPHDITIEELGDETVAEADGGETAEGTTTLEPGEYTVYCSVPGHRQAGMEVKVTAAE